MVQIVGKYQHVSHAPNFESFLKNMGLPEATISSITSRKPTLTISENNGQWTFHNSDVEKEWSSTFKLGEPYNEQTPTGDFFKSVTRREGDKLIIESTAHNSNDSRVYEFNDTGITVHISSSKCAETTSAVYKRI